MPKTQFLGLNLTTDENTKVIDWRRSMDGEGNEEEGTLSNMQLIDKAFGDINLILDKMNGDA